MTGFCFLNGKAEQNKDRQYGNQNKQSFLHGILLLKGRSADENGYALLLLSPPFRI